MSPLKAVILVGGQATRLRPLTCNTSKFMVPVLNRPFFEHVAGYLKAHGITDIVLAVGKSSEQIQNCIGDGGKLGVKVAYSVESVPLGTAGAIKNAERFLDDSFVVLNGDIFTDIDLSVMMQLHRKNKALASLALTPVEDPTIYGVVETDERDRVRRFVEKPSRDAVTTNMINAGIYILDAAILGCVPANTFYTVERDVFPLLLEKGQPIFGYAFRDYWIDIGTPDKYLRLQHDLLRRYGTDEVARFEGESFVDPSARIEGPALIGASCFIGKNAIITGPVVLGVRCRVEDGAVIRGAVLWQDCHVGRAARLSNCLVASGCFIGEEAEILDGCVLGDGVHIGKGSKLSPGVRIWPGKTIDPDTVSF